MALMVTPDTAQPTFPSDPRRMDSHPESATADTGASLQRHEIVLFGLFGTNNFGNSATLTAALHHLRCRFPSARISVVCAGPSAVSAEHRVRAIALNLLSPPFVWRLRNGRLKRFLTALLTIITEPLRRRRTRRALANTQHFVVVGTGALDDFTTAFWEMPMDLLRWCDAARRVGATVSFLSVGAGPIRNPVSRYLMLRALRKSSRRSYRDVASKRFLQQIGFDATHDPVYPDIVFGLPLSPSPAITRPPRVVGVGVMGYYGWSAHSRDRSRQVFDCYASKIVEFIAWLQRRGYVVRLLIGEAALDDRAVQDLFARFSENSGVCSKDVLWEPITSYADLCAQIETTDIVVATRFHNLVGALAHNKPVISVGYSMKNEALLRDFGLGDACQSIETFEVGRLISQFESVCANYEDIVRVIQRTNDEYRRRLEQCFDQLLMTH